MKIRNTLAFILHIIDLVNVNIADVMDIKSNTIKKTVSKVASITPVYQNVRNQKNFVKNYKKNLQTIIQRNFKKLFDNIHRRRDTYTRISH